MDNNLYDMIFKRKSFHLFRNIGDEKISEEEFAKEQAIKNNKSKIILGMIYANEKLRKWYEKYGFKIKEIEEYPSTGKVARMEYIIK